MRQKNWFMESLVPRRSGIRINSSSIGQRKVTRIWCGCWFGRFGLFRIHLGQGSDRIGILDPKMATGIIQITPAECKRRINYLEESHCKNKRPMLKTNNVSTIFILCYQWDSGAHNELEWMEDLDIQNLSSTSIRQDRNSGFKDGQRNHMNIIPTESKRMINYLEETPYQNKRPMLESRQILFQIFTFLISIRVRSTRRIWVICSVVELYHDNTKMPNQVWEETLLALDSDLDEHVLESLYEEKWRSPHSWRMGCHQKDIIIKKNLEVTQDRGPWLRTLVGSSSRTCLSLKKSAQETEHQPLFLQKGMNRKEHIVELEHQQARARMAENVLSTMTRQRKGNAKKSTKKRGENVISQYIGQTDEVHQERKIDFHVSTAKEGNCSHDRESDYWHSPHCKYFKKDESGMGKDCPFVHPQTKERSTSYHNNPTTKKLLVQQWILRITAPTRKPRRTFEQVVQSARWKLPSEKLGVRCSGQSLERAKFRDKFPSRYVIQTGTRIARHFYAPPYDQKVYRVEWGARRVCTAWKHTNLARTSSRQKGPKMCIKQISSEAGSLQRRRIQRPAWWYIPKKGRTSSTMALLCTWWDYLFWIIKRERLFGQSSNFLDIQAANGIVVSDTQTMVYIKELGADLLVQLVKDSPPLLSFGKTMQWTWWFLFEAVRWNSLIIIREDSDRIQHRKFRLRGCRYQTEGFTIHGFLYSQGKFWARTRSGGHNAGSVPTIFRRIWSTRCIFFSSES